jgi:Domain of unknown function (DUF1996)
MKRWLPLLLPALAAGAALTVMVGVAGADRGPGPGGPGPGGRHAPRFAVRCEFSHRNMDDMIVFPAQAGRSHDHTYFGNRSTNAFATPDSLRAAGTSTCLRRGDTAAYWVPTLLSAGEAVTPFGATIYYVRRTAEQVQAFPPGLEMIAGTATATAPQGEQITSWSCAGRPETRSTAIPTCTGGLRPALVLHVRFPNCWDGAHLDSADHKSHMAYSTRGQCPESHPVEVPALALNVRYPAVQATGASLASGGQYSGHGDFVNAWNQERLQRLVDRYLNRIRRR